MQRVFQHFGKRTIGSRLAVILTVAIFAAGCGRQEPPHPAPVTTKPTITNDPMAPPIMSLAVPTNPPTFTVSNANPLNQPATTELVQTNTPETVANPVALAAALDHRRQEADAIEAIEWYNRGLRYAKGDGVARDYAEAAKWFRAAANRGHMAAQFNLAVLHVDGQGVPPNTAEAVQWFQKAGEQGSIEAQFNLAVMYAAGKGVEQNMAEAARWARKAAELGHREAQYNLAVLYAKGSGVKQDLPEAAQWFRRAAEQGHSAAQSNMGVLYVQGNGLPQDFVEARKWFEKAAEQGNPTAQFNLGIFYAKGQGVTKDLAEAYKWCCLAAEQGDPEAINNRDNLAFNMSPKEIAEGIRRATAEAGKLMRAATNMASATTPVLEGRTP